MIKLSDLLEFEQPSEKSKMKNYLYRGSRDQINLHPNSYTVVGSSKGTVEGKGMLDTSDHPENKNYRYPMSWDQANLFEDNDIAKLLIGREFQTLDDLKKIVDRLKQTQDPSDIEEFIINYIK